MVDDRFVGKAIPTSDFAGDDGEPDPVVIKALTDFRLGTLPRSQVLVTLAAARLFVPVKALLDSVEETDSGHQVEKDSHMATVSIQTANGRRGLLAFTSVAQLAAWDSEARPVAAWGKAAAAAAVGEGADALLVDYGSEHMFVIEDQVLTALAEGEELWDPVSDPQIQAAVMESVAQVARQHGCQFELSAASGDADIRVSVQVTSSLDVQRALSEVAVALQSNPVLRERLPRGVELGVVAAQSS